MLVHLWSLCCLYLWASLRRRTKPKNPGVFWSLVSIVLWPQCWGNLEESFSILSGGKGVEGMGSPRQPLWSRSGMLQSLNLNKEPGRLYLPRYPWTSHWGRVGAVVVKFAASQDWPIEGGSLIRKLIELLETGRISEGEWECFFFFFLNWVWLWMSHLLSSSLSWFPSIS